MSAVRVRLSIDRRCLLASGLGSFLAGVVARRSAAMDGPPREWRSAAGRDHPLVGMVFDPATRRTVTPSEAVQRLRAAEFVLLGEKHDNADHHILQAWIIAALVGAGRRPAIALEMISVDRAQALSDWRGANPADASSLGAAIEWETTGWPEWSIYRPIAEAALQANLPLVAADVAKSLQRQVSRSGLDAVDPETARRFGLSVAYDPAQAASLEAEIIASHCGHANAAMVRQMSDVQRLRDAHFATVMIAALGRDGADVALLIAGAGHVRADRGVPWHLARLAPGRPTRTLSFVEVDDARRDPAQYRAGADGAPALFDLLWFTPRVEDIDPCEKFAERLRQMRERRTP